MKAKRVTSADVAREAGVSRTTVSLVLNNAPNATIPAETRRRVVEVAARLNYHPNSSGRRLVSGRAHTIALVMRQSPKRAAADLFLPQVLRGLMAITQEYDYHILLHTVDPEYPRNHYANLIYGRYVDGIILSGPQIEEPEAVSLHEQGQPIVVTGRLPGHNVPCVDVDNYEGARLATNHLLGLGRRRIGMITNGPRHYLASRDRFQGYRDALLDAGLSYDAAYLREGGFTPESGYTAANSLLALPERPNALFVASDVVAIGALQAIKEHDLRAPEDVAVVGFDDVSMARYIEPKLTTISLPAVDLGWHAGQMVLQLIGQRHLDKDAQLLPVELIIRASCGAGIAATAPKQQGGTKEKTTISKGGDAFAALN